MPAWLRYGAAACCLMLQAALLVQPVSAADALVKADTSAPKKKGSVLKLESGMNEAQVSDLIGPPEHKSSRSGSGSQSWHYGSSILFWQGGKLIAWTDSGEVRGRIEKKRKELHRRQLRVKKIRAESGWIEVWEPEPAVSADDVLNDIIHPGELPLRLRTR